MTADELDQLYRVCWSRQEGWRRAVALQADLAFARALLTKGWLDIAIADALSERSPSVVWRVNSRARYPLRIVRLARARIGNRVGQPGAKPWAFGAGPTQRAQRGRRAQS